MFFAKTNVEKNLDAIDGPKLKIEGNITKPGSSNSTFPAAVSPSRADTKALVSTTYNQYIDSLSNPLVPPLSTTTVFNGGKSGTVDHGSGHTITPQGNGTSIVTYSPWLDLLLVHCPA